MLKPAQNRTESLKGGVVVEESLCERFIGKSSPESIGFLDVRKGFFMGFCQRGRLMDQRGQFRFSMASSGPQISQFPKQHTSFLHEFSEFGMNVRPA